ncbi:MAG: hypothetical protein MJE68_20540 [Proteobacteria bacterium]|nr:hypothetical protein [Pseudomonadota bacterium]
MRPVLSRPGPTPRDLRKWERKQNRCRRTPTPSPTDEQGNRKRWTNPRKWTSTDHLADNKEQNSPMNCLSNCVLYHL